MAADVVGAAAAAECRYFVICSYGGGQVSVVTESIKTSGDNEGCVRLFYSGSFG